MLLRCYTGRCRYTTVWDMNIALLGVIRVVIKVGDEQQ